MTNEQYRNGLEQLKTELAQIALDAPFAQATTIVGFITDRIFKYGKSTDGSQIGTYDDKRKQTFLTKKAKSSFNKKQLKALEKTGEELTYKELRKVRGLQVAYVDLQFTGALFENISSGKTSEGAVIGHRNLQEAKIAGYLEKKYSKKIFAPSEEEKEEARKLMNSYVVEKLKEAIKNIFNAK